MKDPDVIFAAKLFYSYSHRDKRYREDMEKSLANLRQRKLLSEWSDNEILPGQNIPEAILTQMENTDIFVFLLSQNFIASNECMREWARAKEIESTGRPIFRIPIILEQCAWRDLLEEDVVKALPDDGYPVCEFEHKSKAWQQVYKGINRVIMVLRKNFEPRNDFLAEMQRTEFLSTRRIKLEDLYIFPRMCCYSSKRNVRELSEEIISNESTLLSKKLALVHGDDMSGKSALAQHLFLFLAKKGQPVLYIDLSRISGRPNERIFQNAYEREFFGDYFLWKEKTEKTLILDNLKTDKRQVDFIEYAKKHFSSIFVMVSSDIFVSYFDDDTRFSNFSEIEIQPLTHVQQEKIIRKRIKVMQSEEAITDGMVDQIENRVNSIILSSKIVPRYPFYVLSILQTYEEFMPDDISITSFGHCYYVLIVSKLIKAGISHADSDINACFNFLENLAFRNYSRQSHPESDEVVEFDRYIDEYREMYIIELSTLNRLKNEQYGIITSEGSFCARYMYFFFLGRFFASAGDKHRDEIKNICKNSYISPNDLIILFTIHHTIDEELIIDIAAETMCTLDDVEPAVLNEKETSRFLKILSEAPKNILREESVEDQRKREREMRDDAESRKNESGNREEENSRSKKMHMVLKNMQILGQILRNRYGSLERTFINELIEIVSDGGLRLVNCLLRDEDEINRRARHLSVKHPEYGAPKIEGALRILSFLWAMACIENIVRAINVPEIKDAVAHVVRLRGTPAHDLIGYFYSLDSEEQLSKDTGDKLAELLKTHQNLFMKSVLSFRTQHYMNGHASRESIEQRVCALLRIRYVHQLGRS